MREWEGRGHAEQFRGRRIHCFHQPGEGPLLLLLHGFPTCSYDWRELIALEPGRAILAFDFLGFGLSDKPRDHEYTLAWQADLAEELVRRHGGGPVYLVAHDMGTSVATELLARDIDGELGIELTGALLFDGSVIIERASLTPGQKLLRSRLGPLLARLSSGAFFRQQLGSVFGREHPMSAEEGADQWALMRAPRRQPHRPQADRLHLRTRHPRRALARRRPRLARPPLPHLGPAGPGRDHQRPRRPPRAPPQRPRPGAPRPRPLPPDRRPAGLPSGPVERPETPLGSLPTRGGSSAGQSSGLIIRRSKVRVLPAPLRPSSG